jgi:hypothetical protein
MPSLTSSPVSIPNSNLESTNSTHSGPCFHMLFGGLYESKRDWHYPWHYVLGKLINYDFGQTKLIDSQPNVAPAQRCRQYPFASAVDFRHFTIFCILSLSILLAGAGWTIHQHFLHCAIFPTFRHLLYLYEKNAFCLHFNLFCLTHSVLFVDNVFWKLISRD